MNDEELDNLPDQPIPPEEEPIDQQSNQEPSLTDEARELKEAFEDFKQAGEKAKQSFKSKTSDTSAGEPGSATSSPVTPTESISTSPPVSTSAPAPGAGATETLSPTATTAASKEAIETAASTATGGTAGLGEAAAGGTAATTTAGQQAAQAAGAASRIAAGRAKVAAAKQAALEGARATTAKMAAQRGAVGAAGRLGAALLSEAIIPVLGWIMAGITLLWVGLKTKAGRYILMTIFFLMMLPGLAFAGLYFKFGATKTPNTDAEKYVATKSIALANDPAAKAEVVVREAGSLKTRFESAKTTINNKYASDETKRNAALQAADEILSLLTQLQAAAGNISERTRLVGEIKTKSDAFQVAFPEIVFSDSSCKDLIPFIDGGQFIISEGPNKALILKGQLQNSGGRIWPVSPDICQALVVALQAGYTITTRNFSATHYRGTATGGTSRHWCGAAIDINYVNGEPVSGKNQAVKELAKLWFEKAPAKELYIGELILPNAFNEFEIKNDKPFLYLYDETEKDHEDHIHLSGRMADTECRKT